MSQTEDNGPTARATGYYKCLTPLLSLTVRWLYSLSHYIPIRSWIKVLYTDSGMVGNIYGYMDGLSIVSAQLYMMYYGQHKSDSPSTADIEV